MGVTPALLVVTRGKLIRMIIIEQSNYLCSYGLVPLIAPFVTETAKSWRFPSGSK